MKAQHHTWTRQGTARKSTLPCLSLGILLFAFLFLAQPTQAQQPFLDGSWKTEQITPILDKTLYLHLSADDAALTAGERLAVGKLMTVGQLFHEIYLESQHDEALAAWKTLQTLHAEGVAPARTAALLDLFYLRKGPITFSGGEPVPFLPVAPEEPGRNVYPKGATRETLEAFLARQPERRDELLHLRSIVRAASVENATRDLAVLDQYPVLDVLHPGLRQRLEGVQQDPAAWEYYGLPYSVAYADRIVQAHGLLNEAADAIEAEDPAFGRYLRLRSRDLLADDYEGGDAAWVTGPFTGNLNAQIGSYETYDDILYGVKSFFSFCLFLLDRTRSEELAAATAGIQDIENALPYEHHRRVRSDIPVSVYNILADFGQSRGTNTATILPNESHLSRQYGRTILIRGNIITNPDLFELSHDGFKAATEPMHHAEHLPEGNLYRTLWHEIGHYLGVDETEDGKDLDQSLQEVSDLFEEMKSDLVSLFAAPMLHERGLHDAQRLRAIYAGGIRRVLQTGIPRRTQPYQTMQLMQWNWYLDHGVLSFNPETGRLTIHYDKYHDAVTSLLREVLAIQRAGDRDRAIAFIDQWTTWDENLHGVIASNMRATQQYNARLVRYDILDSGQGGHSY